MKYTIIFVALVFSACSFSQPVYIQNGDISDYAQGRLDAERDYHAHPGWILAGAGCGIFGVGYAWLVPSEPPASVFNNASAEYTLGYRDGWKEKARHDNAAFAAMGWATWILLLIANS